MGSMAAPQFAHVLADKLARDVVCAWSDGREPVRTRPIEPAGAGSPPLRGLSGQLGGFSQSYVTETTCRVRPALALTSQQREALSMLRKLGASLDDDFNRVQLKRAFRQLALVLHPDRHPGASPRNREQLGARFAVLCEAYRTLSPARI